MSEKCIIGGSPTNLMASLSALGYEGALPSALHAYLNGKLGTTDKMISTQAALLQLGGLQTPPITTAHVMRLTLLNNTDGLTSILPL